MAIWKCDNMIFLPCRHPAQRHTWRPRQPGAKFEHNHPFLVTMLHLQLISSILMTTLQKTEEQINHPHCLHFSSFCVIDLVSAEFRALANDLEHLVLCDVPRPGFSGYHRRSQDISGNIRISQQVSGNTRI